MDPIRNPYVPGAGTQPAELSGREHLLERAQITLGRLRLGRAPKSFIAVGLRGVGKTVLLARIRQMAATDPQFHVSSIEAHDQKTLPELLVPELRRLVLELDRIGALDVAVKRALRVLKSFVSAVKLRYGELDLSLDVAPEKGEADSGDIEADLPALLLAVAKAAQSRGRAIVVLIDELQYIKSRDLSALIMGLHRIAQDGLPLTMIGAGLPQVIGLLGKSKSYAERMFDFPPVDALAESDAIRALAGPAATEGASFTDDALSGLVTLTRGYPYFIQQWGYHAWNVARVAPITADDVNRATPGVIKTLDESFFRVRFDRLTPREKDYLAAMARLGPGPHRSGDIAEKLGISVNTAGPLRNGLISKGMIYSPGHGDTAFTVPLFDEFMNRTLPPTPSAQPKASP